MNRILALLAIVAVLILGGGCSRQSRSSSTTANQITLTAVPSPAAVGESRLVIRVLDAGGEPIDDARLSVKADMSHAGMIPVLAQVDGGGEDGYYELPFEWTMAGDWIVTIEAALPDQTVITERFDLSVSSEDGAMDMHDDTQ
jgi:YtkA-like